MGHAVHNLALRHKLAIPPLACLLMLALVGSTALWGFARLAHTLELLNAQRLPSYTFSSSLESKLRDLNGLMNQSIALAAVGYGDEDVAKVDHAQQALAARIDSMIQERLAQSAAGNAEHQDLQALQASFGTYRQRLREALQMKQTALVSAATFLAAAQTEYTQLLERISASSQRQLDAAGADVAAARGVAQDARSLIALVALAAVGVAVAAIVWVAAGLLKRVRTLSQAMHRLATGDLTAPVPVQGGDEIGRLMADVESVRRQLAASLGLVHATTESLRVAATQIAAGNADLGGRTEATSGSLEQTASSLHQLTTTVDQNVSIAEAAAGNSNQAACYATRSGELMGQVVSMITEVSSASRRIAEVIGIIDRIAAQTNILALNASVESARAGEHGRGFAVVAAEVRSLATQSRSAAQEIATLVRSTDQRVQAGRQLVVDAGSSIDALVTRVGDVARLVTSILDAAVAQSGEISRINQSLAAVDHSTQQNAALAEETSAAAESLRVHADTLAHTVNRFKLG
ncbi:MAG: HAMP domain-containing protein [Burkholderiales bacterium]|nr:HAMP domain-containing protein [Burkholderiales bacterium]